MQADQLEQALREFIDAELGAGPVGRADPLLSGGLIDSVDLASIATFIEQRTGISIPDYDIGSANFDSIDAMIAYVARRRSA